MSAQVKMSRLQRLRTALAAVMLLFGMVATLNVSPVMAAGEQATVGMPFTGKWAYNAGGVRACGPNSGQTSHPSCHENYYGNWGTDIYAPEGAAVTLQVTANGALSFYWISATNGTCGEKTKIGIRVNNVDAGSIYYDHLQNAVKTGAISNGMTVGTVHAQAGNCNPGPHVHIELKGSGSGSCYINYSTATDSAGMTLPQSSALGKLGNTGVTGDKQACPTGTPAANGTDTFGTYNPATAMFYISNAQAPSVAEATFPFGNSGWVPLAGDWNGDGKDTYGAYNPATATFYISNATTPSAAEATFVFGNAGWIPLVGDWDGNGTDTFGVYNPATAMFYISNAQIPSAAQAAFVYGNAGWTPIVGDWDGNGTDTFGTYNSSTATYYISNAQIPSAAEAVFVYGNAGWKPVVGDWDGNRTDTFGTYDSSTATYYISNAQIPSVAQSVFGYGNAGWIPIVGDWNGL